MNRWLTLLVFALVSMFVSGAASGRYYASSKSTVYHLPTCRYVKNITPEHLITFETKDEAQKKGYRPCKVCKP